MCGRRGRRHHHQPLFVKAAVAGSALAVSAYQKHKDRRQGQITNSNMYPNTPDATREPYGNISDIPPYADANAAYFEHDEKAAPKVVSQGQNSTPLAPPPAYEDVAKPYYSTVEPMSEPMHPVMERSGEQRGAGSRSSEPHPVTRPQLRQRKSSASSVSSISSVSTVSSNEYEAHAKSFVPGNARPMLLPNMSDKTIAKHGRKHLRRALKRSRSMDDASLTVLGSMGTLFRIDPAHMRAFAVSQGKYSEHYRDSSVSKSQITNGYIS